MSRIGVPLRAAVPVSPPPVATDPDTLAGVCEDASRVSGGRATGLVRPASPDEVAAALAAAHAEGVRVLAVGAQSSLTGGSVPRDERVVSLARLDHLGPVEVVDTGRRRARLWVGAGVRLDALQAHVGQTGWYYPPVPTYTLATLGGTVSTNASGSATFKYGSTRTWVRAVRMVTCEGLVLEAHRGQYVAGPGGGFTLQGPQGPSRDVPAPDDPLPAVPKVSMGYHSGPPLDLVDLIVGSEGTLGVITEVQVELVPRPGSVLGALVFAPTDAAAHALVKALRADSIETRSGTAGHGLDVRAIEHMDAASLALVRSRPHRTFAVPIPADTRTTLYLEIELPVGSTGSEVLDTLESGSGEGPGARAAARLFAQLELCGLTDRFELALPGDEARARAFREVREAVPLAVNETLRERQIQADARIHKLGGDMCVPFERWSDLDLAHARELGGRGLEYVVFGHISDGNVHPNILARSAAEMEAGREALLALARVATALGGSPLAEHGVGRSPIKQRMLAEARGPHGLARMRAVKLGFDPLGQLARGVLLPAP